MRTYQERADEVYDIIKVLDLESQSKFIRSLQLKLNSEKTSFDKRLLQWNRALHEEGDASDEEEEEY